MDEQPQTVADAPFGNVLIMVLLVAVVATLLFSFDTEKNAEGEERWRWRWNWVVFRNTVYFVGGVLALATVARLGDRLIFWLLD